MPKFKHQGRAGGSPPVRPTTDPKESDREENTMAPAYAAVRTQPQVQEGIAVVGEAVRRVAPDSAEFVVEITTKGPTVSQSQANHQNLIAQIVQTLSGLGTHRADLQTISMDIANVFAAALPTPAYGVSQIPGGAFPGFMQPAMQPDIQFGAFQSRSLLRVTVRDAARAGEIADVLAKAGGTLIGGISYRAADESSARRSALEAAGKDARAKAETLAAATGKQVGDPISVSEDIVATNGTYTNMRNQMPWAFGPNMPSVAGELEYYARVSASFRFQ
jgi:uncharacterized protein YggE